MKDYLNAKDIRWIDKTGYSNHGICIKQYKKWFSKILLLKIKSNYGGVYKIKEEEITDVIWN